MRFKAIRLYRFELLVVNLKLLVTYSTRMKYCLTIAIGITLLAPWEQVKAEVDLRVSVGGSFQSKNVIQNPNTDLGSRFSLSDAVDEDPAIAARIELNWNFNERHNLRILLAPLSYKESVTFQNPVLFSGESFSANQPLDAHYKFNSWRIGYHYTMIYNERYNLQIGGTLKLRDAEIRLTQGDTIGNDGGLGFVPLFYIAGKVRLNEQWTIGTDFDGLAVSRGRAIDLGFTIDYSINERWRIGADFRILEGGVDAEKAFNFVQFNTALISVSTTY